MRVLSLLSVVLILFLFVGCVKEPAPVEFEQKDLVELHLEPVYIPPPEPFTGGDSDEHGCVASAGYIWCEYTGGCERSWELAAEVGFENTATGFNKYCRQ